MTRTGKHYLESRHDAKRVFFNGDYTIRRIGEGRRLLAPARVVPLCA
jgi:hypothetical protein